MSQFMFSMYAQSNDVKELLRFSDCESWDKYSMLYLQDWQKVYDYNDGLLTEEFKEAAIL